MSLVYAAIMPHGDELLRIHPPLVSLSALRLALEEIGRDIRAAAPELVVICSPHHLRIPAHLAIADSTYVEGSLAGPLGELRLRARIERSANRAVAAAAAQSGLAPALCGYATSEESELSCLPLDWGSLVPLSFIAPDGAPPPVVLLGPPRDLGFEPLRRFGGVLGPALGDRRFALIASADLAHAHDADGPYGYDPAAAFYDAKVQEAVAAGDLARLTALPQQVLEAAKADAPWQLAILEGVLGAHCEPRHIAYARPSYFGMLGAGYAVI
ncbi:MAG: hypothetical protein M0Z66_08815 [Thermaerobacter sp.]|nr:hypothetical protein [Thermaerobacter sp.]